MKSLFWKKVEIKKQFSFVKLDEGTSLDYMNDKKLYIYFGGIKPKDSQKDSQISTSFDSNKEKSQGMPAISFSIPQKSTQQQSTGINFSLNMQSNANQIDFVYILNPNDMSWIEQQCKGKVPSRRIYHQTWYEAPYLFVYGGKSADKKTLNDMYVLNTDNYQWKRFFWLEGPTPRLDSALVNMGSKKYIIGGSSMPENLLYNEIWQFSFENVQWQTSSLELPGIVWTKLEVTNQQLLQPIKAHSTVSLSDNTIFIFGGYNQKKQCTDLTLILDIDEQKIYPFEAKGQKPGPRAYHKTIKVKENIVCMFGGVNCQEDQMRSQTATFLNDFYILNINEAYWSRPTMGGYIPTQRYSFSIACNYSESATELYIMGGRSIENSLDKYIYLLQEIVESDQEVWGEIDHQAKLQFEGYREAIKKDKKKQQELKNVSMLTLEFSQAEKVIVDQKLQIGELETTLKNLQEENKKNQEKHQEYLGKIELNKQQLQETCKSLKEEIEDKSAKNVEIKDILEKVKNLFANERKRRKLHQLKSFALQDALRKAENFIITVDSVYNKGQKDDLLEGVVSEDALKKIEKLKADHKIQLVQFRDEFEQTIQTEKKIKTEMKQKKALLQADINISDLWKSQITKDEKILFDNKTKN